MTLIAKPWAATRADQQNAERALRGLIGLEVKSIKYSWPDVTDVRIDEVDRRTDVHEVWMGIELSSSNREVYVTWCMQGFRNGVALIQPGPEYYTSRRLTVYDVSVSAAWRKMLGHRITGVGVAWYSPDDPSDALPIEAIWSVRFEFDNHFCVVISLGELDYSGKPNYIPDGLLVFFKKSLAQAYLIVDSIESAWGIDIR